MIQKPSGAEVFLFQKGGFGNGSMFGLTLDGCTWCVVPWCWALVHEWSYLWLILSLSAHMWVQIPVSGILRTTHTFCDLLERHRVCVTCCIWLRVVYACSVVSDSAVPWTVAPEAPLSMGFSRQDYWSRLPFPSPGDPPNPGIEPTSPAALA